MGGVYTLSGVFACDFVGGTAHYIGSLNHENLDAASFASWGADYLKVGLHPDSNLFLIPKWRRLSQV